MSIATKTMGDLPEILRLNVGKINGNKLRFLNHAPACDRDSCPLKKICEFSPKEGKCRYIYLIVNEIYKEWMHPRNGIGDLLSQIELDMVGIHLMPLYQHLVRFQMEISGLKRTTYESKNGVISVYPQYGEYRQTERSISELIKKMGLIDKWKAKFSLEPTKGLPGLDSAKQIIAPAMEKNSRGQVGGYARLQAMHKEMINKSKPLSEEDNPGEPDK